jgi:hypothetical protein
MASGDTLVIFTPAHNEPPAADYATLGTLNATSPAPVLEFDSGATEEISIFSAIMPRNYTAADTNVTVYVIWSCAVTTGTVGWGVTFESNADAQRIDTESWATEQIITAVTVPGTAGLIDTTNVAITGGATGTDSIAPGDAFRLRVKRDTSADTAAGDAYLIAVEIKET